MVDSLTWDRQKSVKSDGSVGKWTAKQIRRVSACHHLFNRRGTILRTLEFQVDGEAKVDERSRRQHYR